MLKSVQRIGPVLDLFSERPEWGASEVATALGTSKSSAHGLLTTMTEVGLLQKTSQSRYRLGWRLLELGRTLMISAPDRPLITAAMRTAVDQWGETMHFAVYERGAVVYVDKLEGRNSIELGTRVGGRLPAHVSAVGKVILAFCDIEPADELVRLTANTITDRKKLTRELAEVRKRGIAFDTAEAAREVGCVAAPVWSQKHQLVGAISLATSGDRLRDRRDAFSRVVTETAEQVSRQLAAAA
jgi:DNA-binding IclR family transcriptional regulator